MSQEEPIHLEQYDSNWPSKFESEKLIIEQALGSWISGGVEHVGSTAVYGLTAKPIIDIMVGIQDLEKAKECIKILQSIGYQYYPYKPEIMHWFCKPSVFKREYHLYLMESTGSEWKKRIAFRDYLRTHPEAAEEYVNLKKVLAEKFENDRELYTQSKTEFIEKITKIALNF